MSLICVICISSTTTNIVTTEKPNEFQSNEREMSKNEDEFDDTVTQAKKRSKTSTTEWLQFEGLRKDMQKNQEKKLDLIEKILQKSPEKTDLDLFFFSISKTVKKFTPKDQALLKMKIHQIISEKEIEYIDNEAGLNDSFLKNVSLDFDLISSLDESNKKL